ncbi:MAG TPA: LiaF domain-containing protein [Symbiobacteriaceae bacterium]|jgi:hypothetical protein
MERRAWPRSITLPLILIVLGIAFLVSNLGNWNIWDFLIRMWPVWLIAVGLDILIGRQSRIGAIIVAAVTLAILGGGVWYYAVNTPMAGALSSEQVNQPLNAARRADIEINSSIGELQVHESADANLLVSGTVYRLTGETIDKEAANSGDTAIYRLRSRMLATIPSIGPTQRGKWDLGLNPGVPMSLKLGTGVGQSNIDLSRLQVTDLELNTGVGQTTVVMPRQGVIRAKINTGIGQAEIIIPAGMAASIRAHTGIGAFRVNGDYTHMGNSSYVSPNYATAANRLDLEVSGGIGEVHVRTGN